MQGVDAVIFCYNLVFGTSAWLVGLDGVWGFFSRGFLWWGVQGSKGGQSLLQKEEDGLKKIILEIPVKAHFS